VGVEQGLGCREERQHPGCDALGLLGDGATRPAKRAEEAVVGVKEDFAGRGVRRRRPAQLSPLPPPGRGIYRP